MDDFDDNSMDLFDFDELFKESEGKRYPCEDDNTPPSEEEIKRYEEYPLKERKFSIIHFHDEDSHEDKAIKRLHFQMRDIIEKISPENIKIDFSILNDKKPFIDINGESHYHHLHRITVKSTALMTGEDGEDEGDQLKEGE